jgi:CubicO group peptidase (beta-lactamase class C family)
LNDLKTRWPGLAMAAAVAFCLSVAPALAQTAAAPAPAPSPVQPGIDPVRLESFVDGWMTDAMAREHVPGAAVSIVQNGQVIFKKGYGFADLTPRRRVDPDRTLFRIGSISKTFTWVLLMKEVEARRIRLDRPINLYLPEKVRLPGESREVMVRHLMDHSAGFEDRALGQLFENEAGRVRPLDLYLRQERPDQVRPAGQVASYSNYGASLAGEAVAFVSGKTFERRVDDEITGPLGMTRTTFREPRAERRGLPAPMPGYMVADAARGYGWRNSGFAPNAWEFIGQTAPAGSASSTAGDMSRYMLMLLGNGAWNGVTVFGPQAARAFRTPIRREPPGVNGWAHGFMILDLPGGLKGYGHLGDTLAFHSNMTLAPALGLGVFVTTNGEGGGSLAQALPSAVLQHFHGAPQVFPRPGTADLVGASDVFSGNYLTTRRAFSGLEGFVTRLGGGADVEVTTGGALLLKRLGGVEAFVLDGPVDKGRFISANGDERLVFRIKDGRATGFQSAFNTETLQRTAFFDRPLLLIVMAALTALAAVATFAGLALRNTRDLSQNQAQARASMVQAMQAGLWISALLLFGVWAAGASDQQALAYNWPGLLVVTASACALVAAVLTFVTLAALPAIWQGGRRVESWTGLRKTFFTVTVLVYLGFSILLAMGGALEPWSR